jgi:hypothetical protein
MAIEVFITHRKCGHKSAHRVPDNVTCEEIENLFYGGCQDCVQKASFATSLFPDEAEPAEDERRPALRGTPKQVAWGLCIREEKLKKADSYIRLCQREAPLSVKVMLDGLGVLEQETDSHFWIECKDLDIGELLRLASRRMG